MKNVTRDAILALPIHAVSAAARAAPHRCNVSELMSMCDQWEASLNATAEDHSRLLEAALHRALEHGSAADVTVSEREPTTD